MSDKQKFPRELAALVLAQVMPEFQDCCERVIVAGSFRRLGSEVGDLEIVYVPKRGVIPHRTELFGTELVDLATVKIEEMLNAGILAKRVNAKGGFTYGDKNKLMIHLATGLPIDFFATRHECWHNYLVCRTGPAELNILICEAAQKRGMRWNPYGEGFTMKGGGIKAVRSEDDVFTAVGFPPTEPEHRKALAERIIEGKPPF